MYVQNLGDGALSFVFGDQIRLETSDRILKIYSELKDSSLARELSILDIVPAYCSLTFHFDPLGNRADEVEKVLWQYMAADTGKGGTPMRRLRKIAIPVIYRGCDLQRVSDLTGISVREVIARHKKPLYRVAMIGFTPHFPYLIGLDKSLATGRLESPRLSVPAGSVAIGGAQTGIYPRQSPGGWNIIGRTDPRILKDIRPGDLIRFKEA